MIKNERGITLLVLVITIIIMLILVTVGINYGDSSISQVKIQNFSYELQQVQGRVDTIHEKMKLQKNTDYITLNGKVIGEDITENTEASTLLKKITGIDYLSGDISKDNEEYYTLEQETLYRYIPRKKLKDLFDIKNSKRDMIINFKTREVISVQGQVFNEVEYHRLKDIK